MATEPSKNPFSQRFGDLRPVIKEICKITGVPGASIGVFHGGEVFEQHFGYSDAEIRLRPTSKTLFGIGSLTKSFVAAAIGGLVTKGELRWRDRVTGILDEFRHEDVTIGDLLSHRTGLSNSLSLTFQGDGDLLLEQDQLFDMVNNLRKAEPIRSEWIYNNWGYAIAGKVVEKITKKSLDEYLGETFFRPLGLHSTTTRPDFESTENIAKAYSSLEDGSFYPLEYRQQFTGTFFEPAGGAYSNIEDLLKWGRAFMDAIKFSPLSETSPLNQALMLLSNHVAIQTPSLLERSYGLGWARTQLPGVVGLIGDNNEIMPLEELPTLGKGCESRLVAYHQGSTVGYYSALYLDLKTESVVVVLTNSMAIGDGADWISQAVLQEVIGCSQPVDFVAMASQTKDALIGHYRALSETYALCRRDSTAQLSLSLYAGKYVAEYVKFHIDIQVDPKDPSRLLLSFQGEKKHSFHLRHLHDNIFEWSLTFNDTATRGRYHVWDPEYFKIQFIMDGGSRATELLWKEDLSAQKGRRFKRSTPLIDSQSQATNLKRKEDSGAQEGHVHVNKRPTLSSWWTGWLSW